MEIKKDPVDIVIVGFGWTGSLMVWSSPIQV